MRPYETDPFVEISEDDYATLQDVLKQRLPRSAKDYNMLLTARRSKQGVKVYSLDGDLGSRAIIILSKYRKDYGQELNVSVPVDFVPDDYVREALIATKAIDWEGPYFFTSLDRLISPLVAQISTSVKKNGIMYNPNYQYYYDVSDALRLDFSDISENIEMRPLDTISGAKWLVDNWKYSKEGTLEFVEETLLNNLSVGIYVSGNLACGGLVNVHGMVGLLYTDPEYRRLGLGQLCFRYLFREMARTGLIPCSSCQAKNLKSATFHLRTGMILTHETDYILHMPYNEDKVHK